METASMPAAPVKRPKKPSLKNNKLVRLVVGALLVVAVIMAASWFLNRSSTAATIDGSKYQAVFFSNGQVYFGKLTQVNQGYFRLTDVFYIQQNEQSENPQDTSTQSSDIQLIKLGNEVHGPEDAMIISKEQILFFENLNETGKVSQSIKQYKDNSQ